MWEEEDLLTKDGKGSRGCWRAWPRNRTWCHRGVVTLQHLIRYEGEGDFPAVNRMAKGNEALEGAWGS